MASAQTASALTTVSKQSSNPEYRRKCGLSELRASLLAKFKRSKWQARISPYRIALMGMKCQNKWEPVIIDMIEWYASENGQAIPESKGVPVTPPLSNREIAAAVGCCLNTVMNVKRRFKEDNLVSFVRGDGGYHYWVTDKQIEAAPDQPEHDVSAAKNPEDEPTPVGYLMVGAPTLKNEYFRQKKGTSCVSFSESEEPENGTHVVCPSEAHPLVVPGQKSAPLPINEDRAVRVESDSPARWSHHRENGVLTIRFQCQCSGRTRPIGSNKDTPVARQAGIKLIQDWYSSHEINLADPKWLVSDVLNPLGDCPVPVLLEVCERNAHKFTDPGLIVKFIPTAKGIHAKRQTAPRPAVVPTRKLSREEVLMLYEDGKISAGERDEMLHGDHPR